MVDRVSAVAGFWLMLIGFCLIALLPESIQMPLLAILLVGLVCYEIVAAIKFTKSIKAMENKK